MVLGFISLLLTFGQSYIARICIPNKVADTMLPCAKHAQGSHNTEGEANEPGVGVKSKGEGGHRRLLWYEHRMLQGAGGGTKHKCHEVSTSRYIEIKNAGVLNYFTQEKLIGRNTSLFKVKAN